jgi:hypothetical protein
MNRDFLENRFKKYFIEKTPKKFTNVFSEVPLYSAYDSIQQDIYSEHPELIKNIEDVKKPKIIGRIDLIFRYKSHNYVCEIKYYNFDNSEFWDALKVLGYTKYYNWKNNCNFRPAIMIPKDHIKLEHFMISNELDIKLFGISEKGKEFIVEDVEYDHQLIAKH